MVIVQHPFSVGHSCKQPADFRSRTRLQKAESVMETSNVHIKTVSTQNPDDRKCSITTDNKPQEVNGGKDVFTCSG